MADSREPMKRNCYSDPDKMNLPDGKTSSGWRHFRPCHGIYCCTRAAEVCEWTSSRVRLANKEQTCPRY